MCAWISFLDAWENLNECRRQDDPARPFDERIGLAGTEMKDVSIIIKTFERPKSLHRLLHSIRKQHPDSPVIVTDDSRNPARERTLEIFSDLDLQYHCMPFDSGVCKGRNLALGEVKTPFFAHCDDDFILDKRADFTLARELLDEYDLDLIAGLYFDVYPLSVPGWLKAIATGKLFQIRNQLTMQGVPRRFFGNFEDRPDGTVAHIELPYTPPVVKCSLVQNFFLARTTRVRETVGGWNEEIKIGGDHEDFFYRAWKSGLKTAQTESFGTIHYPETNKIYTGFRSRGKGNRPSRFRGWF
jgi:glycosyltransferase involved in cell wall biosynthesis